MHPESDAAASRTRGRVPGRIPASNDEGCPMSERFYRFDQTQVESMSAFKGTNSWYAILDERSEPVFACHVVGGCLGGTSTFHATRDDAEVLFRLEPKRKFLNLTYYVCEGESGPRIATLQLFKGRGMKVSGPDGREQYRVVDPQGKLERLMQDVLDGACGEYALVSDDEVIGAFGRRERPEHAQPARKGLVGRLLDGLANAFVRDWCVELADEGKVIDDHRPLVAAMILLMEQSIAHDQAT